MWYTHNLASVEKDEKIALKCDQQQLQGRRNREKLFSSAFFTTSSSFICGIHLTFLTFFSGRKKNEKGKKKKKETFYNLQEKGNRVPFDVTFC